MHTVTMKFGGTSVGSVQAIGNVIDIVKSSVENGDRLVVIVSAMSGVTNMLTETVRLASEGDRWGYMSLSQSMRDKHEETINRLLPPGPVHENTLLAVNHLLDEHIELCNAITILGETTDRIRDAVVSFGERISSRMIASVLQKNGIRARAVDARDLLITNANYQNALPLWQETEKRIAESLLPELDDGTIPIITGYIGATQDGITTTLGRGGSDFSAAIFAAYVNSDEFIIWTDVDGVMTTDPNVDQRAQVLPYISYQEVGELAFYGAKVLHPKTVQPILTRQIPIRVKNTFNPASSGTRIGHEMRPSSTVIKAVTSIQKISMLTVSGKGMIGVPGIAGRAFLATAHAGANILMISQSSSEQSFCFTVMDNQASLVKNAVEDELRAEIELQNVDGINILTDVVIVTVVGAGMRGTPGVAGRVFTVLGDNNINVLSIAQGSSECSISFVIAEPDLERTVVVLHELALDTVSGKS